MKYLKTESSHYEKPDDIEKILTFSFWFFILDFPWHRRFLERQNSILIFMCTNVHSKVYREEENVQTCMWFLTEKKHQKLFYVWKDVSHTTIGNRSLKKKKLRDGFVDSGFQCCVLCRWKQKSCFQGVRNYRYTYNRKLILFPL